MSRIVPAYEQNSNARWEYNENPILSPNISTVSRVGLQALEVQIGVLIFVLGAPLDGAWQHERGTCDRYHSLISVFRHRRM